MSYTFNNLNEPATFKQNKSLMFYTKYRWASNTGEKDSDGNAIWKSLLTKSQASALIDMKNRGVSAAEIMKQHPLGDKAEPMAGSQSTAKTIRLDIPAGKTAEQYRAEVEAALNAKPGAAATLPENAIEIPTGVTAEQAQQLLAAKAQGKVLFVIPPAISRERITEILSAELTGTCITLEMKLTDEQNARVEEAITAVLEQADAATGTEG